MSLALLLKNIFFTLVVPGTMAVYLPLLIAKDHSPSLISVIFALPLLFIGGAIYTWCIWDFASYGKGTPAPIDAPKKLVVRGLYRYSRNPMYVGVLSVILSWSILFKAALLLFYAVVVGAAFHMFIVFYEEPHLSKVFGEQYDKYFSEVNRWLFSLK